MTNTEQTPYIISNYSAIKSLKDTGSLVAGGIYQISDYQTKHRIAGTTEIHEGPMETLTLKALTYTTFDTFVISSLYPNDIIKYDITNVLCEDGTTPRPGWITYRKDTILGNEVEGFDFRNVVFRRYRLVVPLWDSQVATTGYTVGSVAHSGGNYYISTKKGLNTGALGSAGWSFMQVFQTDNIYSHDGLWKFLATPAPTTNFSVNTADYKDYLIFNTTYKDVASGSKYDLFKGTNNRILGGSTASDIVFIPSGDGVNVKNNTIGYGCSKWTFWKSDNCQGNIIGNGSNGVFMYGSVTNNQLGANFSNHFCAETFMNNITETSVTGCFFGFLTGLNKLASNLTNCIFGLKVESNDICCVESLVTGGLFAGNKFLGGYLPLNSYPYAKSYMNGMYFGDFCSGNTFVAQDTKEVYLGSYTINSIFNSKLDNFGSSTTPVVVSSCVINSPLTNVNSGTLTNVVINTPITGKTLPALTNKVVSLTSPDGRVWQSSIDNAGVITNTVIV